MHRALRRQLEKLGLDAAAAPPRRDQWQALLDAVDRAYQQADRERGTAAPDPSPSPPGTQDPDHQLSTAENRLRAAQAHLKALYEGSPDMIFLHDSDGRLLNVNEQTLRVFGYERDEMMAAGFGALMGSGFTFDMAVDRVRRVSNGEKLEFEWVARRRSGEEFPVEVSLRRLDNDSDQAQVVAVVRDISERKRAEEALRLAATAFETHDGMLIADGEANILRVNQAFTRITGFEPAEVVGRNPRLLQSERHDPAFYQRMWEGLLREGHWEGEIWNRRKNGEVYPQWLSITAVRDDSLQTSHYVAAFVDLSQVKSQQTHIERAAAEEQALSQLLRLSLQPLAVKPYLQQALDNLMESVPWLGFLPKGGVFLAERRHGERGLRLVAARDLAPALHESCAWVPFGKCLCGRAAAERRIQCVTGVDERHEIRYENMLPHGHYNVPILAGDEVLGVMVVYLPDGHRRVEHETAFLARVADVLSMGIMRRRAEAEIAYRAYHDALTGLPNRRLLMDRLERSLASYLRHGHKGAVLFIDLDHFKTVNDSLGHRTGDDLLRLVGSRLQQTLRKEDTVARLGGDEFVVLLPEISDDPEVTANHARRVADKVRAALSRAYTLDGRALHVTPSVGIALFPLDQNGADDILRQADTAMYRAKEGGRNTVQFFLPEMQTAVEERLRVQSHLRAALGREEFSLHFQAQVDTEGRITGAEALLRWQPRDGAPVSPALFIPVAEETGLILPIGEWVLREACGLFRQWHDAGLAGQMRHLAVNVSPRQFHEPGFVRMVERVLLQTEMPPDRLVLELTEGVILNKAVETVEKMQALKGIGVSFSMDDFGTGYSSLAYLQQLPLNILKIDQSFVRNVTASPGNAAIVEAIMAMARHLSLRVIAEGVETAEELGFLEQKGCATFQGYYFSRPVPEGEFSELLRRAVVEEPPGALARD